MVVLHVVAPAAVGGLERVVHALAAGHRSRGHETHVAAVTDDATVQRAFLDPLAADGVVVHRLAVGGRAYRAERQLVADLCRRVRPTVVHTHGYRPDVVDAGAARAAAVPVVSTVHGFTRGGWRNRLYEWMQRRALRSSDHVVAVSRAIADELRAAGVRPERLSVVPNAWRPVGPLLDRAAARRELGVPLAGPLIGWVGRLSQEKGPDLLVEGLASLRDRAWHCAVIGAGPQRDAVTALAQARGVADRITWCGPVPNAARCYRAFDVLLLSSRTEGTPIVLFEAMAAGVPIVAADVGGVADVVSGVAELAAAQPAALAAGLARVLRDGAAAAARADAARERLSTRYALGPWLERYESIYAAAAAGVR